MDELLSRATRAYRDQTAGDSAGADAVLERIERSRRSARARNPRRKRVTALTLAAALIGAGAWAGATGRIAAAVQRAMAALAPVESTPPVAVRRGAPPAARAPTPPVESSPSAGRNESATSANERAQRLDGGERADTPGRNRRSTMPRTAENAAVTMPATEPPSTGPDIDTLYRAAHGAHFKTRDYGAALAAWDAYLAAAGPGSRMLIEARYNRAVALARLGRRDAAMEALEPFAAGEYGEYRREDARRIIENLKH